MPRQERATYHFISCFFNTILYSHLRLGACTSPRDLWKLQLIEDICLLIEVFVFQRWDERIRPSMPIYPFILRIVFQLTLRLITSPQMKNSNTLSAWILSYQDLLFKIHGALKPLHCCKHQTNGKSLADIITLSLIIK